MFLPSLSPTSENDACFGHVAAAELGLEDLSCNLISSCPLDLFIDSLKTDFARLDDEEAQTIVTKVESALETVVDVNR